MRLARYRGTPKARLRRYRSGNTPASVLVLALAVGGCSFQLDSPMGKGADVPTSSLRAPTPAPATALPPEHDLAVARAAVSEFMAKGGKDTSMPWENPRTGARGTITTIAQAYSQNGLTCQDFLASYVHEGNEAWLQGEACRQGKGKWEVRSLKPWQRT